MGLHRLRGFIKIHPVPQNRDIVKIDVIRGADKPFDIPENVERPVCFARVRDFDDPALTRIGPRDKIGDVGGDFKIFRGDRRVAQPHPRLKRFRRDAQGLKRGAPRLSTFGVAQIHISAGLARVQISPDEVVYPLCFAVLKPAVPAARARHQRAVDFVGEKIPPRPRCDRLGNHIFRSVGAEVTVGVGVRVSVH